MILAQTIKGYGLGEAGEGRNVTHQQKKLNEDELRSLPRPARHPDSRRPPRRGAVLSPGRQQPGDRVPARAAPRARRAVPLRETRREPLETPGRDFCQEFHGVAIGRSRPRWRSCGMLTQLLKHPELGPAHRADRPRRGAHLRHGVAVPPVRHLRAASASSTSRSTSMLLDYREATDGQILEEGITEAGSMASFTAAGTSYATHGVDMIPFFIFYSMFGFQRIGDLIWAARRRARPRLPARRDRGPDDLERRRPAARGRPLATSSRPRCRTSSPTIRRLPTRSR